MFRPDFSKHLAGGVGTDPDGKAAVVPGMRFGAKAFGDFLLNHAHKSVRFF